MRVPFFRSVSSLSLLILLTVVEASGQARVEKNVVYGMYSGTALLLDVHYPARPNGFGIVYIPGSGWSAPLGYAAQALKDSGQVGMYVPSLLLLAISAVTPMPAVSTRCAAFRRSTGTVCGAIREFVFRATDL